MRQKDRQLGKPETLYKDTKANIEAITANLNEGAIAYAVDTDELGTYNGTSWVWVTSGGGGGGTDLKIYDDNIFKVTGTAISFNDGLIVHVTGSSAYIDWTGSSHDPVTVTASAAYLINISGQELYLPVVAPRVFWVGPQVGGVAEPSFRTIAQIDLGTGGDSTGSKVLYDDLTWKVPPAGGGGGSGAIPIYDDNVFRITGTAIVFNDGLDISITGSVAYINWTGTSAVVSSITGTSSLEFNWYIDGTLATGTNVGAEYVSPRDQSIEKVIFRLKNKGSSGSSIIDVNKNNVSVFGTRPTILFNDADGIDIVIPNTTSISQNDVLTLDIDQNAIGAGGASVGIIFTGWVTATGTSSSDNHQVEFTVADDLVISTGTFRVPNRIGRDLNVNGVYLNIDKPPANRSIIVDINQTGTSIFANPNDRPTITPGSYSGYTAVSGVTWLMGNYLTADVDQIGSGTAGRDLVITVTAN